MRPAQQTVWRRWLKWFMTTSRSLRVWWQPFTRTRQRRRPSTVPRRRTGVEDARLQPTSFRRQREPPRPSEKSFRSWMASWLEWHSVFPCKMCPLLIWRAASRKRLACQLLSLFCCCIILLTDFGLFLACHACATSVMSICPSVCNVGGLCSYSATKMEIGT